MTYRIVSVVLWLLLSLLTTSAFAKKIPPKSGKLVNDYADVLSTSEERALEAKLVSYDDTTSTQIAVVIEKSTDGEDIFTYAIRLAETWGIGQDGKDNGVLIYIANEDRELRILTGYGAEPSITDAMAKRIIETILIPHIREGKYYMGLDQSTTKIIQLAAGEFDAEEEGEGIHPLIIIGLFFLLFFLLAYLASRGKGGGGGYYRGGHYDDPWKGNRSGGGWHIGGGGGGFSGGGGGGFGGFGGGSFGGGGAGGSW